LKDRNGNTANAGANPFDNVSFRKTGKALSTVVKLYDPTDFWGRSTETYNNIKAKMEEWIEEAIEIRGKYD